MRARFLGCAAILLMGFALLSSTRTSAQDVQLPFFFRLLQGPHTEAHFYTSPALINARSSRAEHFRTIGPLMTLGAPWPSVDNAQPSPHASRYLALSPGTEASPKNKDWRFEVMAWLPFGLLFVALFDRTSGSDELARLLSELSANLNSAENNRPQASMAVEPHAHNGPEQVVAMVAVRGQQPQRPRPRQTLSEWICM